MNKNKMILDLFPEYEQYVSARKAIAIMEGGEYETPTIKVLRDIVNFHRQAQTLAIPNPSLGYIREMESTLRTYNQLKSMVEAWDSEYPYADYYYGANSNEPGAWILKDALKKKYPELYRDLLG